MNEAINKDIRDNANKYKDILQNEVNNIGETSIKMGENIRDTARDAVLQAEQASRRAWAQAEGKATEARIRATNTANEIQQQAVEMKDKAVSRAKGMKDQALSTANDIKDQAEVAVGIQQESGFFSRINPMQYLKMPTLANITNKLSPKNLFCSSPTTSLSPNNNIYQMGGNKSKQAIIELLQYNLVKREKILNILFEDLMSLAAKNKKIPKKNEKKVLKLLHEIDLIKKKINRINYMIPIVKKNKLGAKRVKYELASKSRKKKKTKNRKTKNKRKRRKNITKRRKK